MNADMVVRRHLLAFAAGVLLISSVPSVKAQVNKPVSKRQPVASFIVLCDCETLAKRARVKHAIRKKGGIILYTYENLGGFAVATSPSGDPTRLEQELYRIPYVRSVEPDGEVRTNTQN
ncbi:hypothetical protein [Paracidovorax avenae]|uniref:hypothetical protein n=1 Tax=Paracidovorax avenae TaxID=80867 RepID=UPI0012603313|nr:hypothetical protein [Paracidovorax avenae]